MDALGSCGMVVDVMKPNAKQKRLMDRISKLPCIVCGRMPVEIHHARYAGTGMGRRNLDECIPLCPDCHRHCKNSRHNSPGIFKALHGDDKALHEKTCKLLNEDTI